MKRSSALFLAACAVALVFSVVTGAQTPAPRASTYNPPKTREGQPDLQGVWRVWNLAKHDILAHPPRWNAPAGPGVVIGDELPYQPWALAKKEENFKNSRTTDALTSADPMSRCYLPGVPRITYLGFPFQILQTADYVAFVYEWRHVRRIAYLKDIPRLEGLDLWMGSSRARFEGNTLVVEVRNLSDRTWFDESGNFHSAAARVIERYTPTGPDTLQYEVTVNDPKVFTREWKMAMPIQRQRDTPILEYECHALLEESGVPITWDRLKYFK